MTTRVVSTDLTLLLLVEEPTTEKDFSSAVVDSYLYCHARANFLYNCIFVFVIGSDSTWVRLEYHVLQLIIAQLIIVQLIISLRWFC